MSPAKGDHPPPTSPGKRKDRDESAKKAKEPKKAKEAEGEKSKKASHRPTGHTKNSLEDAKKTELLNKVIAEVFELRNEVRDLKDTLQEVLKLVRKMDGTVGKAIGEDKWEEVEVRLALDLVHSLPLCRESILRTSNSRSWSNPSRIGRTTRRRTSTSWCALTSGQRIRPSL